MKKRVLGLLLPALLSVCIAMGQMEQQFSGMWEGKLNLGRELRIVFHFTPLDNGGLAASLDSPDQMVFGLVADTVTLIGDNIVIKINRIKAAFTGRLINDSVINGSFLQLAISPLSLKKSNKTTLFERPQTPMPPFPYKSEEVEYDNAAKTLHYGGAITIPSGAGPFPAVLLINGSGAQDRNGTIADHQLFAVLADALTREGFIVLRVDDRGIGKSTGFFADATTEDFARDVNTSFGYLLSRPETDKRRTGLIGHSEGGMIAPMIAAGRKDVAFLVLLGAPGIPIKELMMEQNAAILRSIFIAQPAIDAYLPLYRQMLEQIPAASDSSAAFATSSSLFRRWIANTDSIYLKQLGFVSEEIIQQVTTRFAVEFSTKWMRYFLSFDPQPYLRSLRKIKLLALNGSRDIQVLPASNLAGIEKSLKSSKVKYYTVKEVQGLNHLFQTCKMCSLAEYVTLPETFSPIALEIIKDWLKKNVAR